MFLGLYGRNFERRELKDFVFKSRKETDAGTSFGPPILASEFLAQDSVGRWPGSAELLGIRIGANSLTRARAGLEVAGANRAESIDLGAS
ncbi:hypothetical protein PIB30_004324 [Stylosanthes scabra]|uniref:Uncharacterized protein n=1 Tax=Stylosanthes scabra TaxID=79078 RepID=A0ABU6T3E2_9FABA|nr:hypothetical protein [Stylosanthes scabra]